MLTSNKILENDIEVMNNGYLEEYAPGSQHDILKTRHATFTSFPFLLWLLNG